MIVSATSLLYWHNVNQALNSPLELAITQRQKIFKHIMFKVYQKFSKPSNFSTFKNYFFGNIFVSKANKACLSMLC